MARVTGQRISSILPAADTPREAERFSPRRAGYPDALNPAENAALAWRTVTAALAGTPHVRLSFDGGRTYPARHARRLPADPPESWPCTVPVFDPGSAMGRMLALDFDVARADGHVDDRRGQHDRQRGADPAAGVAAQAGTFGELVGRLGGLVVADVAPGGGRHVFVLFASALPWRELRDLCRAIAVRFPAVDPAPMSSMGAQISPPGSRHKSGGWRTLSTTLSEVGAAVEHPNGPEVWAALLGEFAAELALAERGDQRGEHVDAERVHHVDHRFTCEPEFDDAGVPWVPRLGGRANLGPDLARAVRTGRWDRTRHAGRSEARMAILCASAARGWRLADVRAAIASGAWKGFPGLYYRASEPGRMDRLLPLEWRKCVAFVEGEKNVYHWLTSDRTHAPPAPIDGADEFGFIRRWATGTDCAAADPERVRRWGRRSVAIRQLLAAIGQAAMVSGSSVIEFRGQTK